MADFRDDIIIAIHQQGFDSINVAEQGIKEINSRIGEYANELKNATITSDQFVKKVQAAVAEIDKLNKVMQTAAKDTGEWAALQARLGEMEEETAKKTQQATDKTNTARNQGTQFYNEYITAVEKTVAATDKEEAELAQLAKGLNDATIATRKQIDAFLDLEAAETMVSQVSTNVRGQFGGFGSAAEQAADKTKKFGYAAMNASYLIQDMQYGIGAVANNIGLMTTSLANASPKLDTFITKIGIPGGAVGLGAGIMFAAVAADILHKNWDHVAGALAGGLAPKFLNDIREFDRFREASVSIAGMKDRLEDLSGKWFKVDIDYSQIETAEKLLEVMEDRLSAFKGARRDNLQDEMAKQAKDAMHLYGGGSEEVKKIIMAQMAKSGQQFGSVEDQGKLALLEGAIANMAGNPMMAAPMVVAEAQAAEIRSRLRKANISAAEQEAGAFAMGDAGAIARMQGRAARSPELFGRAGPGGLTFGEAVANLPGTAAEMLRRIDQEEDAKQREEKEKATSQAWKAANQKRAAKNREVAAAENAAEQNADRIGKQLGVDQQHEFDQWLHEFAFAAAADKKSDADWARQQRDLIQQTRIRGKEADPNNQLKAYEAHLKTLAMFGNTVQIQAQAAWELNNIHNRQRSILHVQNRSVRPNRNRSPR